MSEQGDKARKALHDMRWGPHIEDFIERQEKMDDAIRVASGAIAALEADNKEADRLLLAAAMKYTGLEARLSKMETRLAMCEMALRVAHLPLPPYGEALAGESDGD